ncbi:MAG: CRISPR-associated endoribonuclease Cas6 [Spirochaetes bacterium]|nr:CRISPR-associated endoribonuclease Cas6 [Spirochaetota bacterium]
MRLVAFLSFTDELVSLPTYYRIGFASLIKEALKEGDPSHRFYSKYYTMTKNRAKPFTFAVKLNVEREEKGNVNKLVLKNKMVTLYLSSNDYEFIIAAYNGLKKICHYPIYQHTAEILRFALLPERKFFKTNAHFRIFSPVVVRKVNECKKANGYATIEDSDYVDMLRYSIKSQCEAFLPEFTQYANSIRIATENAFTVKIPHYNKQNNQKPEIMTATDGYLSIEAHPAILKLVYDIGLGARRSQGFGMLEVVE